MSLHELVSRSLKVLDRSDANFRERRQREVRRMPLLRGWMNSCRSRQRAGCLALPLEPRLVERHAEPVFRFGHVRDGGVAVLRSTDDFAHPHFPGKKEEQPARVPRRQSRFPPDLLDLLLAHVRTPLFYCIGGGDPAKDLGFDVASERDLRRTLYGPLLCLLISLLRTWYTSPHSPDPTGLVLQRGGECQPVILRKKRRYPAPTDLCPRRSWVS